MDAAAEATDEEEVTSRGRSVWVLPAAGERGGIVLGERAARMTWTLCWA